MYCCDCVFNFVVTVCTKNPDRDVVPTTSLSAVLMIALKDMNESIIMWYECRTITLYAIDIH